MEKIENMIKAFSERTVESATKGFIVECNDDLTNAVKEYLNSLPEEELIEVQTFLSKLLNLCYNGSLFESSIKSEELNLVQQLSKDDLFLFKETIIYFYGRLPIKGNIDVLKKAYYMDDNKYIKLNITFTSLEFFDEEIENDFVNKLVPGSEYDIMLRSWTLAFFKNADNPYDYRDNGGNWEVAKKPRIDRFAINDENNHKFKKAMAFRLLDFVVLDLFLENRKTDSLTDDEKKIVQDAFIDYDKFSENKIKKLGEYKRKIIQY